MAAKRRSTRSAGATGQRNASAKSGSRRRTGGRQRFAQVGTATSKIVREAAHLLDEEVAAGIVAAKQMQDRFKRERRIDPADFQDSVQRFQNDAHEMVTLLDQQFAEIRSDDNAELVSRLLANAHDLVDVLVGVVNMGVDIANQLAETNLAKPAAASSRSSRRK